MKTATPARRVDKVMREVDGVFSQYGIDSWTREFLDSIAGRAVLSAKQEAKLREVEVKVFGEAYDPFTTDLFAS